MNCLRLISGGGFGALLGLMLGLSISETVASFLITATAIGAVILGVAPLPEKRSLKLNQLQLSAFALSCIAAIFFGLYIRTHNLISPTTDAQVEAAAKWVKAGVSADYAASIVTGVSPPTTRAPSIEAKDPYESTRKALLSALSSGNSVSTCANLDPTNIHGVENRIRTLRLNDLSPIAEKIERAPQKEQDGLYTNTWKLLCQKY